MIHAGVDVATLVDGLEYLKIFMTFLENASSSSF